MEMDLWVQCLLVFLLLLACRAYVKSLGVKSLGLGLPWLRPRARASESLRGLEIRDLNGLTMSYLDSAERARLLAVHSDMWRVVSAGGPLAPGFDLEFAARRLSQVNPRMNTCVSAHGNRVTVHVTNASVAVCDPCGGSVPVTQDLNMYRKQVRQDDWRNVVKTCEELQRQVGLQVPEVARLDLCDAGLEKVQVVRPHGYLELHPESGAYRPKGWAHLLEDSGCCYAVQAGDLGMLAELTVACLLISMALVDKELTESQVFAVFIASLTLALRFLDLLCWGPQFSDCIDVEDVLRGCAMRYVLAPLLASLRSAPLWAIGCEVVVWSFCLSLIKRGCRINLPLSPTAGLVCCPDRGHGITRPDGVQFRKMAEQALVVEPARCASCARRNLEMLVGVCLLVLVMCEICVASGGALSPLYEELIKQT
jgi:hypothetical protein